MLPDEVLALINQRFPCRESQVRSLASLYNRTLPSPVTLVVHGTEATGKSSVVKSVLQASGLQHAIINCRECVTGRHLLEKTMASCLDALDAFSSTNFDASTYARTESVSALAVHLQGLLEGREKFVLVFDGIDRQREVSPTLLAALVRFGEVIPDLSTVLVMSVAKPHLLNSPGVLHLEFGPYNRDESLKIVCLDPPDIFNHATAEEINYSAEEAAEDNAWLWNRFCGAVWDSLAKSAAKDVVNFRAVCEKLWRPFVNSIEEGTFGTRDFARLMVAKRHLFQGEDVLIDKVIDRPAEGSRKAMNQSLRDLPYYSKYILCAAYLASFNPAKQDQIYFMKAHEKRRKRRAVVTASGRAAKHRRISRHLLNPSSFPLDRLLAILHSILPEALSHVSDLETQISTLTSLRLLQKAGASSDALEPGGKWKVNFGWDYALAVGRSVGFEMSEWVAGGTE